MSDNIEQQRKELQSWIDTKPAADVSRALDKENDKTSAPAAALRGALSGLSAGQWPKIAGAATTGFGLLGDYAKSRDESEAAQEKAWQDQGAAYGTGYGAGTAGSLLIGPGIALKGVAALGKGASKAAPALNKAFGEAVERAAPVGGKAASEFAQGVAEGAGSAFKESPQFAKVMQYIKGSPNISGVPLLPKGARMSAPIQGAGVLESQYPEEGYAEGGEVEISDDEKRRQAMMLQSTPQGRAQTNTDSD